MSLLHQEYLLYQEDSLMSKENVKDHTRDTSMYIEYIQSLMISWSYDNNKIED